MYVSKETEKKAFLVQEDYKKTHVCWSQHQQDVAPLHSPSPQPCPRVSCASSIKCQHDDLLAKIVTRKAFFLVSLKIDMVSSRSVAVDTDFGGNAFHGDEFI
jgi:hypothetical protein